MAEFDDDVTNITKVSLDFIDAPLVIPTNKLDADQYGAEDIDGVTESLFGSGNMAYASLQASQSDEVLALSNNDVSNVDTALLDDGTVSSVSDSFDSFTVAPVGEAFEEHNGDIFSTDTDRDLVDHGQVSDLRGGGVGSFTAGTIGSVGASQLSSDTGSFASSGSGLSLGDGLNGENGSDGSVGNNGSGGQDGQNAGGDGTTIINNETVINLGDINLGDLNLGDIDLGDLTELVDNVFINLGDTISNVTTTISDITNILDTILNNETITNILDLSEVTNIVTNLTETLTMNVTNTLTEVTNITDNITNFLGEFLGGDGIDPHLLLDVNVLDSLLTSADVPLFHLLDTDLDLNANLTPALDFVDQLASSTGLNIVSDALGDLAGVTTLLQGAINEVTDVVSDLDLHDPTASIENLLSDLSDIDAMAHNVVNTIDDAVGNLLDTLSFGGDDVGDGLLSQTLDPVGAQGGDVLDTLTDGLTMDVTDQLDGTVDMVTDVADELTGGILGGVLGESNENDNGADSDLGVNLSIDVIDQFIADNPLDVALDPVEDLLGDIDVGIGLDTSLLGSAEEQTDNDAGDSDITLDTQIDVIDNTLGGLAEEIPLDAVEGVIGDVDLDIDAAVNLLGDMAAPLINEGEGGSGEDTLLAGIGDAVSDILEAPSEEIINNLESNGISLENILGDDDSSNDDGLISDTIDPVIEDGGDVLDTLTSGATDQITDDLTNSVDAVSDIADDLTGGLLGGILGNENDNQFTEGTAEDSDVTADFAINIGDNTLVDNPAGLALDPLEDVVGDIDLDLNLNTDLLGHTSDDMDNGSGDSDVSVETNIELVDNTIGEIIGEVAIDPVEDIVGDVDVSVDGAVDILGDMAAPLVNEGEGGSGEDTLLAEGGDVVADIVEPLVEEVVEVLADTVDVVTDVLSGPLLDEGDLAGEDSDLLNQVDDLLAIGTDEGGLGEALGLLGPATESGNNTHEEDTTNDEGGLGEWTESISGDSGGVFDDLVDGLGGAGDVLPDPVGTVAEGLGILDTEADAGSSGGLLGGLFG